MSVLLSLLFYGISLITSINIELECELFSEFVDECVPNNCTLFESPNPDTSRAFVTGNGIEFHGPFDNTVPILTTNFTILPCIRDPVCEINYRIYWLCNVTDGDNIYTSVNDIIIAEQNYSTAPLPPDSDIRDAFVVQCGDFEFDAASDNNADARRDFIEIQLTNLQENTTNSLTFDGML